MPLNCPSICLSELPVTGVSSKTAFIGERIAKPIVTMVMRIPTNGSRAGPWLIPINNQPII